MIGGVNLNLGGTYPLCRSITHRLFRIHQNDPWSRADWPILAIRRILGQHSGGSLRTSRKPIKFWDPKFIPWIGANSRTAWRSAF